MSDTHKKKPNISVRMPTERQLLMRVQRLERDVQELKRHIDPDTILDAEDRKAIAAARRDAREGKLVTLEELHRRLERRRCAR